MILTGEFAAHAAGDPDYERIADLTTRVCRRVDPSYTDRFLENDAETRKLPDQ